MFQLDKRILSFPDLSSADEDGALAYGGDLSQERLLLAYRSGIFPWFSGNVPVWYSPDPRFVLYPDELRISKSMNVLLKRQAFRVTFNQDFPAVIRSCKITKREGQSGTWITRDMERAYIKLHESGYAHSVEAWNGDKLAGGLYGIRLGHVFFGESMFSHESNASKYAFITFVQQMMTEDIGLIDCQVYTPHLESLGARLIPRDSFKLLLDLFC
jgi:leucyl/phenylalanyl-tRNA---protein transferase